MGAHVRIQEECGRARQGVGAGGPTECRSDGGSVPEEGGPEERAGGQERDATIEEYCPCLEGEDASCGNIGLERVIIQGADHRSYHCQVVHSIRGQVPEGIGQGADGAWIGRQGADPWREAKGQSLGAGEVTEHGPDPEHPEQTAQVRRGEGGDDAEARQPYQTRAECGWRWRRRGRHSQQDQEEEVQDKGEGTEEAEGWQGGSESGQEAIDRPEEALIFYFNFGYTKRSTISINHAITRRRRIVSLN